MHSVSSEPTSLAVRAKDGGKWLRTGAWMLVVVVLFVYSSKLSYLVYHTLVEAVTVGIALLLGFVTWHTYSLSRNNFLAFLGLAFPAIAVVDFSHMLVYKGMSVLPVPGANTATQLWIAARYFEALVLLVAPLYLSRPLRLPSALALLMGVSAALVGWIASGTFPVAYVDGTGLTPFKIYSEYVIVALLLAATAHLWSRREAMDPPMFTLMVAAFVSTIVSELAFTFYVGVYDVSNFVGHLFKLLAFWLIFRAIVSRSLEEPFRLLSAEVSTYDAIPQPVVVVDSRGLVRQTNRAARRTVSVEPVGSDCHLYHPSDLTKDQCPLCHAIARGESLDDLELHYPQLDRWMNLTLTPLPWRGKSGAMVQVMHDVTARKSGEIELLAANRALTTVSASNHNLVHAENEEQLLTGICETILRKGGYRFAWVGFVEPDAVGTLRPAKFAGEGSALVTESRFSWHDEGDGWTPEGEAVRGRVPVAINNIGLEPPRAWHRAALAQGFASVLAFPLHVGERPVVGVLALYSDAHDAFTKTEIRLLTELADDLGYGLLALRASTERSAAEHRAVEYHARLGRSLRQTVVGLAATIEIRDPYTAGHQRRVSHLSAAIGREMGLSVDEVEGLEMGGAIHDIGKIYVPAEILNRPGPLSANEFEVVRTHCAVGCDIIEGIEFPWALKAMVQDHHERLDGSGYPRGLKGDEITLAARIIGVADVVEAMCSHRPHRSALGVDAALKEVRDNAGTKYDPAVVAACERLFREKGYTLPV